MGGCGFQYMPSDILAMSMGTCMDWAVRKDRLVVAFNYNGMLGNAGNIERWTVISVA